MLAARLALEHGVACNTAGGSHHAFAGFGAGFCVFNDVAVAARVLLAEGLIGRALVVDLDVHQGDGTAAILADDPRVFTLSLHCRANFPARKQQSDLDVALDPGVGDADYLEAVGDTAAGLARPRPARSRVLQCRGRPACRRPAGTARLERRRPGRARALVLRTVRARGLPLACVVGGGYADDLDVLARRHALLHEAILELPDW